MASGMMHRSSGLSFLGVLPALSPAASAFVTALELNLTRVRLVCKDLREFVDNHVHHLRIEVEVEDLPRWSDGQIPSLARYTSLRSLELMVFAREGDFNEETLASLTSLPFAGLELSARQRITQLNLCFTLQTDNDETLAPADFPIRNMENIIPLVVTYLPYLRKLDLESVRMSYTSLLQQRMHDALAALPHLEELVLGDARALDHVGILAGNHRLTRLSITGFSDTCEISARAVEGILRLRHLTELDLSGGYMVIETDSNGLMGGRLLQLLNNLPRALRKLEFQVSLQRSDRFESGISTSIELHDGQFCAISLLASEVCILSALADVLLGSRGLAAPHRLASMHVECVHAASSQPPLAAPKIARMRGLLLERCMHRYLGKLELMQPQLAVQVLEVFGKPETIIIRKQFCALTLRGPEQPTSWAPEEQQPPQQPAMPLAREIARRVTNRLLGKSTGLLQGADAVEDESTEGSLQRLMLLQGELVTSLGRIPNGINCIMNGLAARATMAAGAGGGAKCLLAYQMLPAPTGAVLLDCSRAAGAAEAVTAAVRYIVEGLTPGKLEVLPVALMHRTAVDRCNSGEYLLEFYFLALQRELQDIWDARGHIGGAAERKLVQQLMERARELNSMPVIRTF